MHFVGDTVDDLMHEVLTVLLSRSFDGDPSRAAKNGKTSEIISCSIELTNPRARLSRSETRGKPISAIGELFWYLAGKEDLESISYYISGYRYEAEQGIIYGAYGPRIFKLNGSINQLQNIVKLLTNNSQSRRAVIQIFDGADIAGDIRHIDIPCTCSLQFLIRSNKLHMIAHMRSNDAYKGLPHDIFTFTMIQEILANTLNVEIGSYYHHVGSLHLYESNKKSAEDYIKEGYHSTKLYMPSMPYGDQWSSIEKALEAENLIRNNLGFDRTTSDLPKYWLDLIRLLQVYALHKNPSELGSEELKKIREEIGDSVYRIYIDEKSIKINK